MKKIRLNKIFYFSWGGLTLTDENPSVEANEELIEKMDKFIKNGYLKVTNGEDEIEELIQDIIPECNGDTDGDKYDFIPNVSDEITVKTERVPVYSKEALEKMNKKELLKIAKDMGLTYAKSATVKDLENLIYDNQ